MKTTVDIIIDNKNWKKHKFIKTSLVENLIKLLASHFPNLAFVDHIEIAILLTDDQKMQELNKEFRNQNKPTNVLSFPDMIDDLKKVLEFGSAASYIRLGDLSFGYDVITKEAIEQDKSFDHHFIHLLVHGTLHLLGFDHETNEEDASIMEKTEIDILKYFDIESPY